MTAGQKWCIVIDMDEDDVYGDDIEVTTPSGTTFVVLNEKEKAWYEDKVVKYTRDNIFQNESDLAELDRIMMFELFVWRYGQWISLETDYDGQDVEVEDLQKAVDQHSKQIIAIKTSLGIDKSTRDKGKSEDIAEYITNLGRRGKAMGLMRNEQAVKAITLMQEAISLVQFHDNCTPEERKENHVTESDIVGWLRAITPEFQEIDAKFRETNQKYWVTEQ